MLGHTWAKIHESSSMRARNAAGAYDELQLVPLPMWPRSLQGEHRPMVNSVYLMYMRHQGKYTKVNQHTGRHHSCVPHHLMGPTPSSATLLPCKQGLHPCKYRGLRAARPTTLQLHVPRGCLHARCLTICCGLRCLAHSTTWHGERPKAPSSALVPPDLCPAHCSTQNTQHSAHRRMYIMQKRGGESN